MRRGFLNLADLGEFTASAVENDTISFIASYRSGSVFTCNLAFCRLTGFSKDEVSEMKWPEDFTTAEDRSRAIEIVKGTYCGLPPYSYELEFVRKDGTIVPVDIFVHKFSNEAGTVLYYYSFVADMTEHKRLEYALRKSEAKYRELVENANSIILKMDTKGNITFFNEFAQAFFRYGLNEILGKNVIGTIVPLTESSGRDLSMMIKEICDYPEHYTNNENENMRNNGERVWVSWTNRSIKDDKGNLLGILSVGNDITDLKRAETELKRSRDELEIRVKERTAELEKVNKFLLNEIEARKRAEHEIAESEEKFRTLAETSPVAILFHRGIGFIYTNPAAEKIFGRSFDEIKKMNFWELFAPEFQQMIKERGLARLRGENPPPRYEVRLQTESGEKWIEITNKRLMYQGNPSILTVGLDVTQYKQTLTALNDSKVEAELYVDLMSHDINNMHQIAIGYLELARDQPPEARQDDYLDKSIEVLQRSTRLIQNVRKLQKLSERTFQTQDIDVCRLLMDLQREFGAVPGKAISYTSNGCEHCYVRANELLHDVFANLVSNAIKHTRESADISISLSLENDGGRQYCRVSVEDNGPGIPDELKPHIFNRALKSNHKAKGMGLGLYLVKTLVDSYSGKVWVEDRVPGDHTKGARFVVMIPTADK